MFCYLKEAFSIFFIHHWPKSIVNVLGLDSFVSWFYMAIDHMNFIFLLIDICN